MRCPARLDSDSVAHAQASDYDASVEIRFGKCATRPSDSATLARKLGVEVTPCCLAVMHSIDPTILSMSHLQVEELCCDVDGFTRLRFRGCCRGRHAPAGSRHAEAMQPCVPASMKAAIDDLISTAAQKPPPAVLSDEQVVSRYQAVKAAALAKTRSVPTAVQAGLKGRAQCQLQQLLHNLQ